MLGKNSLQSVASMGSTGVVMFSNPYSLKSYSYLRDTSPLVIEIIGLT